MKSNQASIMMSPDVLGTLSSIFKTQDIILYEKHLKNINLFHPKLLTFIEAKMETKTKRTVKEPINLIS